MKKVFLLLSVLAGAGWLALGEPSANAGTGPKPATGAAAKRGEVLFNDTCRQCHPVKTETGGIGPSLKGLFGKKELPATNRPVTDENVKRQIRQGGAEMPGYGSKYSTKQIADLVAYLKTL